MAELVLVASDLEIGAGGRMDDFPGSAWMVEWLAARPPADRVDLVLAGDTFDFLKTPVDGGWPRHIDAAVALAKLERIAAAHGPFLDGLRDWLAGGDRRVWFITGNHDLELSFPAVQDALRARLGAGVHFAGTVWRRGELEVVHGHMHDTMFRVEGEPLLVYDDRELLNLPWGAVAMLDVAMPFVPELGPLDRLKPRGRVFDLLPEARQLARYAFGRYWAMDWWRDLFAGDPVKRVTAEMLREVLSRMRSGSPVVATDGSLARSLQRPDGPRVLCVGHFHRAGWQSHGARRLLMLGAFRNEFELFDDGRIGPPLPKTHAEVWMEGEQVLSASLVESVGPSTPQGYMPTHVDELRPVVDALLAGRDPHAALIA